MTESTWEYFTQEELGCHGTCPNCAGSWKNMNPQFMQKLVAMRKEAGFPFKITSGYRCPDRNVEVAKTGVAGPHTTGRAVDIAVYGIHAYALLMLALKYGVRGIGVHQKGALKNRYLHLDDVEDTKSPRPRVWSY